MFKYVVCLALLSFTCTSALAKDNFTQKRILNKGVVHSYRWIATAPSGVQFTLVQRVPDQTRSFYIDKGFSLKAANEYASACVMQTIFNNNTSDKTVTFNLANWRVIHNGISKPLKLRKAWLREWKHLKVPNSARIAFRWSQFPTYQKHSPGDWFQGMIAAGVSPGSKFDLKITWTENGVVHTATMKNIQCAKDISLGE
ncbi:MAG: hypothetical protein P8Z72_03150 [Gammaproteobacteria bacterium]